MVKNQLPRFPSTQEVKKEFQAWLNQPVTAHFENLWLHNRNGTEEHKSEHTGAYKTSQHTSKLPAHFKMESAPKAETVPSRLFLLKHSRSLAKLLQNSSTT